MGIALTVQKYIEGQGVPYEVATHERTTRSSETAKAGSISANSLAKGVLIKRQDGFLLAILPASRHVRLEALSDYLNERVSLASEADAARIFADCAVGSLPPLPAAYGLTAVVDDSLEGCDDIYFEGGDHSSLSTSAAPASGGFWAGCRMLILASATIEADRADCAGPAA